LAAKVRAFCEAAKATTEQTKITEKVVIAQATGATLTWEEGGPDLTMGQVKEDTVEDTNPSTTSTQLK